MNASPTDGEQNPSVPDVPPPVPSHEPKPKLAGGFFILGLFTPWLAVGFMSIVAGVFGNANVSLGWLGGAVTVGVMAVLVVAWLVGRSTGNNRLRSWGLGGVLSVALQLGAVLLLYGACMLVIAGPGGPLGG